MINHGRLSSSSSPRQSPENLFRVGDTTVTRIDELRWVALDPIAFFPELDEEALADGDLLPEGSYDPQTGRLTQSSHSWLLKMPGRTVLIDTGTGNGKSLPKIPALDHLSEPYLERLADAGVSPEDVDAVLMTHLHADHVGWNTVEKAGQWLPTFTNARHYFSRIEHRYVGSLSGGEPAPDLPPATLGPAINRPAPGTYEQSVRPVIAAGLAELIAIDGSDVLDGLSFHPTPGHSIDHASIRLRSGGEEAWFLGDVLHHPLQVYRPDLRSVFCEFPEPGRASRRWALEQAAETGAICFTSHFVDSSVGRITRQGDRFAWRFEPGLPHAAGSTDP